MASHWIYVVSLTLVGIIVAIALSLLQTPKYQATASAFVSIQGASTATDLNQGSTFTQQVVKSYANLATSSLVLDPIVRKLRLPGTSADLAKRVSAEAPTDEVIIEISATDPSRITSARIANAVTSQLALAVDHITSNASANTPAIRVTQIQTATPPTQPSTPNFPINIAIGLALGTALGMASLLLRELLDTRIRGIRDIEHVVAQPIIGAIAFDPKSAGNPLVVRDGSKSPGAEAFRTLRTNLQFFDFQSPSRAFVVTSSVEGEGKSTSTANLALAIADTEQPTVVVDADLRRSRLANYFGIDGTIGLTDVLLKRVNLEDALQQAGSTSLYILPAGTTPPNPSELLQSDAMIDLIEQLKSKFTNVIFDTPPLLPVSDAAILSKRTSGAIVACGAGRARTYQLKSALGILEQLDAHVIGIFATMLPRRRSTSDAYSYYTYGYSYGTTGT